MLPDCMSSQILGIIAALGLPVLQLNFLSTYFTKNIVIFKVRGPGLVQKRKLNTLYLQRLASLHSH